MHYLYFLLISLIWGSSFILMKIASENFGTVGIGALRCLTGGLVLYAILLLTRQSLKVDRAARWHLLFCGSIGTALPYAIQPFLIARFESAFIGMMVAFVPLLTVIAAIPMLKQYPSKRQCLGVLGGLCCLLIILWEGKHREVPLWGLAAALVSPACYALTNTYIRLRLSSVHPSLLTAHTLGVASLLLVPMALTMETVHATERLPHALCSILFLGLAGTGLAIYWFMKLIVERGALFSGMVTYLIPLGALVWGWLDGETVTLRQLLALLGVLSMIALVQFEKKSERSASAESP